ncbi:hypothetical protein C0J52_19755 [Blattella germanica]|nr:hypothetical protein C0J52_19755 [Blattella germanica]
MWSTKNLVLCAIILDEEERRTTRKRKRTKWVHDMLKERNTEGEYFTLFQELTDDDTKFFQYFRMSKYQFNDLLSNIEEQLQLQNTTFREAISAKQKLCVCLR